MKATEYAGRVFTRGKGVYTKFTIGSKVQNSMIERVIIGLGGRLIKETKMARHYEMDGDQMRLIMIS